jgi:hypothetical protein
MRSFILPLAWAMLLLFSASCSAGGVAPCFICTHVHSAGLLSAPVSSQAKPNLRTGSIALSAKTKTKTKSTKDKKPASSGGFGAKTTTTTSVDAAALLRKSMDLYDALSKEDAMTEVNLDDDSENEPGLREYVFCVRSKSYDATSDWVPAACMGVMWSGGPVAENPLLKGMADHNLFAPIAAKLHCREVWESACQAAPSLRKLPRNSIEYGKHSLQQPPSQLISRLISLSHNLTIHLTVSLPLSLSPSLPPSLSVCLSLPPSPLSACLRSAMHTGVLFKS